MMRTSTDGEKQRSSAYAVCARMKKPSLPARRPSAGAMPGRCGFSLAAKRTGRFHLLLGRLLWLLVFWPHPGQGVRDLGPYLSPAGPLLGGQLGPGCLVTHAGQIAVVLPMFQRPLDAGADLARDARNGCSTADRGLRAVLPLLPTRGRLSSCGGCTCRRCWPCCRSCPSCRRCC